jgi:fatty acid desaturase
MESRKVSTTERKICCAIRAAEQELRGKYPLLKHQDAIALFLFLVSLFGILLIWVIYFLWNVESYWAVSISIFSIAFANSMLHELEHDLIHNLYFKNSTLMQDVIFTFIWFSKLHGHPWYRRDLHLRHHIISGQVDDIEERLIGLGLPIGWRRLVITAHPIGMPVVSGALEKAASWFDARKMNRTSLPTAFIFFSLFKSFMAIELWHFLLPEYASYAYISFAREWLWHFNILLIFPNILRQSCLHLMSNATHYYGDIPEKSIFYQNQILDHPLVFPFQLFCCNFGATHIVHHYVPNQPFYIRELVYRRVKKFMVENGVRNNDLGTLLRGNRYFSSMEDATKAGVPAASIVPLEQTWTATFLQNTFPKKNASSEFTVFFLWCLSLVTVGYATLLVSDSAVSYYLVIYYLHKNSKIFVSKN